MTVSLLHISVLAAHTDTDVRTRPPTTTTMADRMREGEKHEIKKSSYYVWFLGAKESRGLRGDEFISPVVKYLMGKEREQAPIKVTLQLSNKGMKIIQNMSGKRLQESYRVSQSG